MERKTILVVEDDAPVRGVITETLEKKYRILEAANYAEAIAHLRNHIDLAVIDYHLPDKDGFEVIGAIREKRPLLPAIMITGFGHETLAIKAIRAGVTDYIKKPLSLAYLRKRVSEILKGENFDESSDSKSIKNREEFILDGIEAYIKDNYMENITLDKIANKAGMSKFKFCRVFKERFGQSFISYLNNVRMQNAAYLIKNTDLKIAEISHNVGYGCVTYFERIFKSRHGISPIKFRRKAADLIHGFPRCRLSSASPPVYGRVAEE